MNNDLKQETRRLRRSWDKQDASVLCGYLVRDVEDPRINIQSILCRHFLIERLFGDRYSFLQQQEIRFGLFMNWLLRLVKSGVRIQQLQAILFALMDGSPPAETLEIPRYVSMTFSNLLLPNYICSALNWYPEEKAGVIPDYLLKTFETIWNEVLSQEQAEPLVVLEMACGSANDYRYFESYGIAKFLEYRGIDLSRKNIANAQCMYPTIRFEVGNAVEIEADDASTEVCLVQDLFEHLSLEAMEQAVSEICRVTRKAVRAGFFNMEDQKEHHIQPVRDYHWNTLSMSRTRECFARFASSVEMVSIDEYLRSHYDCEDTHNKKAYFFIVKSGPQGENQIDISINPQLFLK